MGGLWCDYERTAEGGLAPGSPRNQQTNVPGIFAIGECDYQFHGANRLGANSLVACIFSGLTVAPGVMAYIGNLPARKGRGSAVVVVRSGGLQAFGRVQRHVGAAGRRAESVYAAPGARPADDQKRNGGAAQCRSGIRLCQALRDGSRRPGIARRRIAAIGRIRTWYSSGRFKTCFRWQRPS